MNRFKIQNSFAIEPDMLVFAGEIVEGRACAGMKFRVPEAGHAWEFVIRSVEFIRKAGGDEMVDKRRVGAVGGVSGGHIRRGRYSK
jgi:hypothetical protein